MSQIITYGFFGEDKAQRNFLEKYLNRQFPNTFIEDEELRWRVKVRNRDQVDAALPQALLQRAILRIDVLFVGRDIDSEHEVTIQKRRDEFTKTCANQPALLMLPVQCVEHWLWYIKRHQEEPGKNTPLESHPRSVAKQAVYGKDPYPVEQQLEIANDILASLDVPWLESRSESFRHFHQQVTAFLTAS